jgi:DNA-binding NarL/FixJ family response regulator
MLPLKVLVADDHRLFRQGLVSLMHTREDLVQVIGEACSGHEAVRMAFELRPDVVLLDIYMPDSSGLEAARQIRRDMPGVAVVMLTSSDRDEHLYEAMHLGAAGYLLKDLDASELFDLLEGVAEGETALTRAMATRLLKAMAHQAETAEENHTALSEREVDVLRLVAQGYSNPQIAQELFISVNTVKSHIKNILMKLNLENRTQVARYAVETGLV